MKITLYQIFLNSTLVANNSWASSIPILYSLDNLTIGFYNLTIIASDGYGGIMGMKQKIGHCTGPRKIKKGGLFQIEQPN